MMRTRRRYYDAVVVGGGVVGVSSAWWLARAGLSVAVLERRSTLGSLTTPNALGTIRTQYSSPSLVALASESLEFYHHIETHLGVRPEDVGWANRGYLYLTDDPVHVPRLESSLAEYTRLGVTSSELLDQSAIHARYSFAGGAVAGIFHGDGSWVDPARITHAWVAASPSVDHLLDSEVLSIEAGRAARWEVVLPDFSISADSIVVASGPYAPSMLEWFGVRAPVRVTPRYRAFIPDDDPSHALAPLVINIANGAYWRPVPGGVWLSHANVDDRTVEPAESVEVPAGFLEQAIDQIEPISPALARTARAAEPSSVRLRGGYQVYPADDAPIIGEVPGSSGVFMNVGHWAGIMLSPASGRIVADCVVGGLPDSENPYNVGRFDRGDPKPVSTNKFGGWG